MVPSSLENGRLYKTSGLCHLGSWVLPTRSRWENKDLDESSPTQTGLGGLLDLSESLGIPTSGHFRVLRVVNLSSCPAAASGCALGSFWLPRIKTPLTVAETPVASPEGPSGFVWRRCPLRRPLGFFLAIARWQLQLQRSHPQSRPPQEERRRTAPGSSL